MSRAEACQAGELGKRDVLGEIVLDEIADSPHLPRREPTACRIRHRRAPPLEAQQLEYDVAEVRSFHPEVTDKPGRIPLGQIKLLKVDPAELEKQTESIRTKYAGYFGT